MRNQKQDADKKYFHRALKKIFNEIRALMNPLHLSMISPIREPDDPGLDFSAKPLNDLPSTNLQRGNHEKNYILYSLDLARYRSPCGNWDRIDVLAATENRMPALWPVRSEFNDGRPQDFTVWKQSARHQLIFRTPGDCAY